MGERLIELTPDEAASEMMMRGDGSLVWGPVGSCMICGKTAPLRLDCCSKECFYKRMKSLEHSEGEESKT